MTITQSEVAAAIATEEQNWELNNLLPGLVVKAQVQEVNLLLLKYCDWTVKDNLPCACFLGWFAVKFNNRNDAGFKNCEQSE